MDLDQQRGGSDSLFALYYLVPAAEEEDLLEELRQERADVRMGSPAPDVAQEAGEEDSLGEGVPLSFAQALGLLRHLLGAEVIDPSNARDAEDQCGPPHDC